MNCEGKFKLMSHYTSYCSVKMVTKASLLIISEPQFGIDDVWSIQKNVSLGKNIKPPSDGLNLKANKTYYSRYGSVKGIISFSSILI